MKSRKLSISFSKEFQDVYDYLSEKPNISHFVCESLREKMHKSDDNNLEKLIERIVEDKMRKRNINSEGSSKVPNDVQNSSLEEAHRNLIDSIF